MNKIIIYLFIYVKVLPLIYYRFVDFTDFISRDKLHFKLKYIQIENSYFKL